MEQLHTTGTAAIALGIPQQTLIDMETRGAVGPWQRDMSGRRLLTADDLQEVLRYVAGRKATQGSAE